MALAQYYRVPHSEDSFEHAKPGQFVFPSNHSDVVSGFIAEVNNDGMVFCLFEPTEAPEGADVILETMPLSAVYECLGRIMQNDHEVARAWLTAAPSPCCLTLS